MVSSKYSTRKNKRPYSNYKEFMETTRYIYGNE